MALLRSSGGWMSEKFSAYSSVVSRPAAISTSAACAASSATLLLLIYSSLGLREMEIRARGGAFGPARRDGFQLGPEAHALFAVHVHVAEQGTLPAAKAVGRDGNGDRHVDADHADL